jgi:hypothetical protein
VPLVSFARDVEAPALTGKWTTTDPPINFVHIEFGEINRRGEAVGYPTGSIRPVRGWCGSSSRPIRTAFTRLG